MTRPSKSQTGKPVPTKQIPPLQIEQHFGPICEWHIVDHFDTVEEAQRRVDDLLRDGHHAQHSIIEGLCVVARRNRESPI